jgi:hypothetical protein
VHADVDVLDEHAKPETTSRKSSMQVGVRKYPAKYPPWQQKKAGCEKDLGPKPMFDAPCCEDSHKLQYKVVHITGGAEQRQQRHGRDFARDRMLS